MGNSNTSSKSNKKVVVIFVIVVICSFFIGGFSAIVATTMHSSSGVNEAFKNITNNIIFLAPYISVALNLIFMIIGFSLYAKCKKKADNWDGENEDVILDIENELYLPLCIPAVMVIINSLLFAVCFAYDIKASKEFSVQDIGAIIGFLTFILSYVWEMILQGKVIALEKKINPEKRGNILDMKFQKEWVNSCDEAEKMAIYKSSYDTYKVMNNLMVFAWVVTLLGNMTFNTGLFPVVIVVLLWLVQTVTYLRAAKKYS